MTSAATVQREEYPTVQPRFVSNGKKFHHYSDLARYIDSTIGVNALRVIAKRYSIKDSAGVPQERWADIVRRVVRHVATAEHNEMQDEFTTAMTDLMDARVFLPNTPCLVNAGKTDGQLAGCFVLPVPDSIKGIMNTASNTAVVHQSGGGTGFDFSTLRPAGAIVQSTHGVASGPVSFMEIFDKVTDVVKQGGVRRGANMGVMRVDHPDILRFIHAKNNQDKLTNFNISVAVTDEFMKAVDKQQWIRTQFESKPWTLPIYDPVTDKAYNWHGLTPPGMLYAPDVWNRIVESAHGYAEPGVIFIDTVNRHNLLKASMGEIRATNPCAEQALHENNSCNLGSLDLSKFFVPTDIRSGVYNKFAAHFNWPKFAHAVRWSVRFLDNIIDTCTWPTPEINEVVKRTRPVGLGVMGFADLCLKMQIRYGSDESLLLLDTIMKMLQQEAWKASTELGAEKGVFPEFKENQKAYENHLLRLGINKFTPRNYEVTTIAPTGTISLVAETSSGIEPNFAWAYIRQDTVGTRSYLHPIAADVVGISYPANAEDELAEALTNYFLSSAQKLPDYFVTAHDVTAEQHVRVLAAAQLHVDNGVSKTVNGHADDTVASVKELYELAHKLGVKAISYYRDGSRDGQVLQSVKTETTEAKTCPECKALLDVHDGCETCGNCGWGKCAIS